MSALFGTKYFGFIAASYGITFAVLLLMVIWVLATYAKRKRDLARLEQVGIKRASNQMAEETQKLSLGRLLVLASPLLLFGGLAAVFFIQLTSGKDTSELPSALIGKPAPSFSLGPLAGLKRAGTPVPGLKSEDLKGKISLVNIFASWCAPCRAEHPVLLKLAEEKGLNVVGINYKDTGENALRFLGALGNPYAQVGVDTKGRTAIDWGFYGIPETLLVGPDGIVRHKIVGPIDAKKFETLRAEIKKLQ